MATAATGWICEHKVSKSETETTATITVTCYWRNNGWMYDIGHVSAWVYCGGRSAQVMSEGLIRSRDSETQAVSCGSYSFTINKSTAAQSISCYAKITSNSSYASGTKSSTASTVSVPKKTSYTVSYSANGGSGAPSSQTKWYGSNLTLSSTIPTRTGYSFMNWLSSAQSQSYYKPGALYGHNASTTMIAQWKANTYTVTFDANGGSDAPSVQTKTYGTDLTLSSKKPTRENYNFLGWGLSAATNTVTYSAGGTYTENAAITLYAVWEIAYIKPRISNISVERCDSEGNISDGGACAKVIFSWETDENVTQINISWTQIVDPTKTSSVSIYASGKSGTVNGIVGGNEISTDLTYTITLSVADSEGSTAILRTLSGTAYTLDFLSGGKGAAFGKPAEKENGLEVAFDLYDSFGQIVDNGLARYTGSGDSAIDPDTTLDHLILTNKNTPTTAFHYIQTFFYADKADSNNKAQIAFPYNANGSIYHRFKSGGVWSNWKRLVNDDEAADYIVEQGINGFWTYQKFASGVAKCWGKTTITFSGNYNWDAQGVLSYMTSTTTVKYPEDLFIESPVLTYSKESYGALEFMAIGGTYSESTTTLPKFRIVKAGAYSASSQRVVAFKACGKWKK